MPGVSDRGNAVQGAGYTGDGGAGMHNREQWATQRSAIARGYGHPKPAGMGDREAARAQELGPRC